MHGAELATKYKIKRRFVLLVLGTVFEQVFAPSKGRPTALATSLLDESKEALGNDTGLVAELNVLGALFLGNVTSYLEALDYFRLAEKKRACELAVSFARYEDLLYLLKDETDPLTFIIGMPSDQFLGALQSYLLGHQIWRAKVHKFVQKLKGLAPDRLASFAVKFGSIHMFPEFCLQIAVDCGHEESLCFLSVPLLASVCHAKDDSWCSKVPVGVVSDACELLNSLPNSGGKYSITSITGDFFRYSISSVDLQGAIPSYLGTIQGFCSGKAPITQLIRFNPDLSLFTLGRLYIALEDSSSSESDSEDIVLFKKPVDFSAELELLTLRKQHLTTQAMSLPSTHLSFDLSRSAFVIDTNVLVACPSFLETFYDLEARVYVPVIVLEELVMLADHPIVEKSTKAMAALNWFDAVYPSHQGHKLVIKAIFATGRTSTSFDIKNEPDSLGTATNDDLILKICTILGKQQQTDGIFLKPVIISDDVNMRLKGKAMGIQALSQESFTRATFTLS